MAGENKFGKEPREEVEVFSPREIKYKSLTIKFEISDKILHRFWFSVGDDMEDVRLFEIKNLTFEDDGKLEDLQNFIPEDCRLAMMINGLGGEYIRDKNIVGVQSLGREGDQFRLVHEIAHARQKRLEFTDLHNLSKEELKEKLAFEEEADRFALKTILKLREQGIDLEPEIEDLEEYVRQRDEDRKPFYK